MSAAVYAYGGRRRWSEIYRSPKTRQFEKNDYQLRAKLRLSKACVLQWYVSTINHEVRKLTSGEEPQLGQESDAELGASILLEPKYPLLIHEDIDYAIRRIQCSDTGISVFFEGYDYMQLAEKTWSAEEKFVIVTHTQPCASPGEHAAYL